MKTVYLFLTVSIFAVILFFSNAQKSQAYAGVIDVVIDPANVAQTTVTAGSSAVSAGANVTTAAMTTADKIKTYVLDPLARTAAKMIIKRITAQTVNWINSGFQGNPAFVTNPGQFFLNVSDEVAGTYISGTALNRLCSPFRASVRLALVKNYISEGQSGSCTLSSIRNNFEAFTQDFTQGGWDGWFEMTQVSGNNPYGAYLEAQTQLEARIDAQVTKYSNQLNWGRGFLSFETCNSANVLTQADIDSGYGDEGYSAGDCYDDGTGNNKETSTPGSVIETQLEHALGTDLTGLELAKNFDEVVSALVTQLFTRVVGGGSGLRNTTAQNATPPPPLPNPGDPVIVLQGQNPFYVQTGARFNDPGVTAYDGYNPNSGQGDVDITNSNCGANPCVTSTNTVDSTKPGNYTATYTATSPSTGRSYSLTREVIVGVLPNNRNSCLETSFRNAVRRFPTIIAGFRIQYGNIDEDEIKYYVTGQGGSFLGLSLPGSGWDGFIKIIDKERLYLLANNKPEIVNELEDLMRKLEEFHQLASRGDENKITDVLDLERARKDLIASFNQLMGLPDCGLAPLVAIDVPTEVPTPTPGPTPTPTPSTPATNVALGLTSSTGTYPVGQSFTVDINLDTGGTPVDGVDVYSLHYNPAVLQVVDAQSGVGGVQITPGTSFPVVTVNTVDPTNGTIQYSTVTSGGTTFNGTGRVATILFNVIGSGSSPLTFDFVGGSTSDTNVSGDGVEKLNRVVNITITLIP